MPRAKPKTTAKAVKAEQQKQHNKKVLLEALEKSLGVVTTACKAVNLDRTTHYRYLLDDADYAAAVREIEDVALDFAESKLHGQIQKGDTTACIFYLKTKGKRRGYVERIEQTGADGKPMEHKHNHDYSKLTTEELLKLKEMERKLLKS